jgi:hypothetical protein
MRLLLVAVFAFTACAPSRSEPPPLTGHHAPSAVATASADDPCQQACVSAHGTELGASLGVTGYSNCSERCIDETPHTIDVGSGEPVYTGIRYQCVEYARRWWLRQRGVVFGSVDTADDMWSQVREATSPTGGATVSVSAIDNGQGSAPAVGDLVIYAADPNNARLRFGHVAVVVDIDREGRTVRVAEQNFDNAKWTEPTKYSRSLELVAEGQRFSLHDQGVPSARIYGWLRLAAPPPKL